MPKQVMTMRLKKDIVIPAGTMFTEAPLQIRYEEGCYSHTVGLTKNSSGDLVYCMDPMDKDLEEWFEPAQEWA